MPLKIRTEYRWDGLDLLSELQCRLIQLAFACSRTDQVDLQHGKISCGHFLNKGLLSRRGNLGSCRINGLSDVIQCLIQVLRYIELNKEARHPLRRGRAQLDDTLKLPELDLHRLHQQSFGIARRNTLVIHSNIK